MKKKKKRERVTQYAGWLEKFLQMQTWSRGRCGVSLSSMHTGNTEWEKFMLAWLRNVNIAILVSHVSWNVLTSSTLLAQPCTCTITLNGHAHISNLHCQLPRSLLLCCKSKSLSKINLYHASEEPPFLSCSDTEHSSQLSWFPRGKASTCSFRAFRHLDRLEQHRRASGSRGG